jgi:hypothetical protein
MRHYFIHTNKIKGQQYNCLYYEFWTDTLLISLRDSVQLSLYSIRYV